MHSHGDSNLPAVLILVERPSVHLATKYRRNIYVFNTQRFNLQNTEG
jgi:hypothetical protein